MNKQEIKDYKKAGEILAKVREYSKKIIKPGTLLLDIAREIENKILELGGEIAFPVNLSINEVAAHYHSTLEDKTIAQGLLKVDLGIHINGYIADSAFSLDLSKDKKYTKLIQASKEALDNALELLNKNPTLNEIGSIIEETIKKCGFSSIRNLSGHGLSKYDLHSGIVIPNYPNKNSKKLLEGAYAIEPFSTTGKGEVYEGNPSNIYVLIKKKNIRNLTSKKILNYIIEKHKTLPFSLREIQEKFGKMARFCLKDLEKNEIVYSFPQLIEKSHKPVAQSEHTFIKLSNKKIIITTK